MKILHTTCVNYAIQRIILYITIYRYNIMHEATTLYFTDILTIAKNNIQIKQPIYSTS